MIDFYSIKLIDFYRFLLESLNVIKTLKEKLYICVPIFMSTLSGPREISAVFNDISIFSSPING